VNIVTLVQPNQPTHDITLARRSLRDCLAEELRRLDPDDLFGKVLQDGLDGARPSPPDSVEQESVRQDSVEQDSVEQESAGRESAEQESTEQGTP
jgi:glucose-6-phosphate dehydrogenase assembly protein OpcA